MFPKAEILEVAVSSTQEEKEMLDLVRLIFCSDVL